MSKRLKNVGINLYLPSSRYSLVSDPISRIDCWYHDQGDQYYDCVAGSSGQVQDHQGQEGYGQRTVPDILPAHGEG